MANYLKQFGWTDGELVTVRARASGEGADASIIALEDRTLIEWDAIGATQKNPVAAEKPCGSRESDE